MRALTLLIPCLSWPHDDAAAVYRHLEAPWLARCLGRSQLQPVSRSLAEYYQTWFGVSDVPEVALSAHYDGLSIEDGYYLRADPVHVQITQEGMRLVGPDVLTFSLAEAEALAATLNASFATEGMRFLTPTPDRWYVHLAAPPQAVFTPLQQAILRDMRQAMPTGAEGKRWSRYLNEVQMLWFEHPVNQQREQQGEPALNSVWFWGETTPLPTQVAKPNFSHIATAQPVLAALAQLSHTPLDSAPYDYAAAVSAWPEQAEVLVELDSLDCPARYEDVYQWLQRMAILEENWFAPAWQAWSSGQLSRLTLIAPDHNGFVAQLTAGMRWQIWRRPRPLTVFSAE